MKRPKIKWPKEPIFWEENNKTYCSVVFSWQLPKVLETRRELIIGGPAVYNYQGDLPSNIKIGSPIPTLFRHNLQATRTTIGCTRKCGFCVVPKIEADYKELSNWSVRPILIDNNFLACSNKHFNSVIDKLKPLPYVEFNQGLDVRLLTKERAERLAELKIFCRLAFDNVRYEKLFLAGVQRLRNAGIPKSRTSVYVLIGYKDTPDDALYRLNLVRDMGMKPNPMRYQPIDTQKKNSYVAPNWTHKELQRYVRYFSNLRFVGSVPFSEFEG